MKNFREMGENFGTEKFGDLGLKFTIEKIFCFAVSQQLNIAEVDVKITFNS